MNDGRALERSPWRDRGDALLSIAAPLWLAFCGALYASLAPSPDQWFLDYTGWMITDGAVPYRTFLDGVWPMGHWLHALSTLLFGTGVSAWRSFDFLFLVLCTAFGADLARRLWGRAAGWWMLCLYPALYIVNSPWFEGERDLIAANAGWIALWAYWRGLSSGRLAWQVPTGCAIAFSALVKPTFLALGVALGLHAVLAVRLGRWSLREALAHMTLAAGSAAAGLAIAFTALVLGGTSLQSFAEMGIRSVSLRFGNDVVPVSVAVSQLGSAFATSWHWIGAGAVASLAWRLRRGQALENLLLPLALLSGLASYFAQGQALGYTIGPIWAATISILCSGLGLASERWRGASGWRRAAVTLLLLVAVAGTAKKLWTIYRPTVAWWAGSLTTEQFYARSEVGDGITTAEAMALAHELREELAPDEPLLVWGRANAVSVLAERRQPTRFHHYVHLTRPYLPEDLEQRWSRWFREDLTRDPPRFCLVNPQYVEGLRAPRPTAAAFLAEFLARDYVPVRRIGESTLHERKPPADERGGSAR